MHLAKFLPPPLHSCGRNQSRKNIYQFMLKEKLNLLFKKMIVAVCCCGGCPNKSDPFCWLAPLFSASSSVVFPTRSFFFAISSSTDPYLATYINLLGHFLFLQIVQSNISSRRLSIMELKPMYDVEETNPAQGLQHDLWPLGQIEPKKAKFPCCLVWTPLPVVSWLAPFIGHVGICREDGAILDFYGSNFVNVDDFAYGAVARYLQLDREQCCFPPNLVGHTCKQRYRHSEYGTAITWDVALQSSTRLFEHKSYNIFTCNCHSFVANCLNRLCYGGTIGWNMVNVAALILFKGHWVDTLSVLRSFLPFTLVTCLGIFVVGWPFLIGLLSFSLLLLGWFLLGSYCVKNLLEC